MKITLITEFPMQWVDGFKKHLGCEVVNDYKEIRSFAGHLTSDIFIHGWLNAQAVEFINTHPNKKHIVFIRRYEYYTDLIEKTNWENVDRVIFVNSFLGIGFYKRTQKEYSVIWNGVDLDKWTYKERGHGKKIAIVGFINQRKNIPLALQILSECPDHELHIAGGVQDGATMDYLLNLSHSMGLQDRVFFYGQLDTIDDWLEDKNYLLCTAISEGNPNNVIEAMAKGIKPIVHNWPGSKEQFGKHVFNKISEAVEMIKSGTYDSESYRDTVQRAFSGAVFNNLKQVVMEVSGEKIQTFHNLDCNASPGREDIDCYIVSYPKSGRTWLRLFLQVAIHLILKDTVIIKGNLIYPVKLKHPKIMFTHTYVDWLPKKTIFLTRDIRDVLVSSYFHCQRRSKTLPKDVSISEFIRSKGGGAQLILDWHKSWESRLMDTANYCEISYEDLGLTEEFGRMLDYIGIEATREQVELCMHIASFDETRKNIENGKLAALYNNIGSELSRFEPTDPDDPESHKLRRGKVGGYVDYLSKEDIEYIEGFRK